MCLFQILCARFLPNFYTGESVFIPQPCNLAILSVCMCLCACTYTDRQTNRHRQTDRQTPHTNWLTIPTQSLVFWGRSDGRCNAPAGNMMREFPQGRIVGNTLHWVTQDFKMTFDGNGDTRCRELSVYVQGYSNCLIEGIISQFRNLWKLVLRH